MPLKHGGQVMKIPKIDPVKTGKNIRRLRKEKSSVKEFVDAGICRRSIYHWELGQTIPAIDSLLILSEVLNVSFEEILSTKYSEQL